MRDRGFLRAAILLAGLTLGCVAAQAAELLYVSEPGCPYCRLWDAKVRPLYGRSAEGRLAPLRPLGLDEVAAAGLRLARPVRYTPTFILVADGAEIGRIEGYPGEDFFWGLLARLVERLPVDHTRRSTATTSR